MPKYPSAFDWRKSTPHFDLLDKFSKPNDVYHVISMRSLKRELGEDTEYAIDRFIRDGALEPSTIEETMEFIFQAAQLKDFLKERDLKITGNKGELIERLIKADRSGMVNVIPKGRIMKCSANSLKLITDYKDKKKLALDSAKKQSFNALQLNDPSKAYSIYCSYQEAYVTPNFRIDYEQVQKLTNLLTSQPKILSNVSSQNLMSLKVIAGFYQLWQDDSLEPYSSSNNLSGFKNDRIAVNFILSHNQIAESLKNHKKYSKKVLIKIDSDDFGSCGLCQELIGKVIDIDKVPEFPMVGCISEIGCICKIDSPPDERVSLRVLLGLGENEENKDISESINKLRQLKQMLNENLISEADYEMKKAEVLLLF